MTAYIQFTPPGTLYYYCITPRNMRVICELIGPSLHPPPSSSAIATRATTVTTAVGAYVISCCCDHFAFIFALGYPAKGFARIIDSIPLIFTYCSFF